MCNCTDNLYLLYQWIKNSKNIKTQYIIILKGKTIFAQITFKAIVRVRNKNLELIKRIDTCIISIVETHLNIQQLIWCTKILLIYDKHIKEGVLQIVV